MRLGVVLLAVLCSACASTGGRVRLDHYAGVVATHFGGIPAASRVCAQLTNPGPRTVRWVKLRLKSESRLGAQPGRWVSHWMYRGEIAPGESVAIVLPDAPVADRIALRVRRSGGSSPMGRGRDAVEVDACSEPWLEGLLAAEADERPDAEIGSLRMAVPGEPDIFVAEP